MRFNMWRNGLSISLLLSIIFASFVFASDANYIYDDTGRLIKVIPDTGDAATYNYDAVGNLISITTQTISQTPPVLLSISPDIVFTGTSVNMTITGNNLLTTTDVKSDNAGISIGNAIATDTTITALLTISSDAPLGQANINVTTLYGSANIPLTVANLSFNPQYTAVVPGNTGNITVSIEPVLSKDYTVSLNNINPDIIEAPLSVTIPAGNNASFAFKALQEGAGVIITAENAAFTIYVSQPFTGDATAATKPVSVYIEESSIVNGTTATVPVSVYIEEPSAVNGTIATVPVSVYVEETIVVNGTTATVPVSVYVEESTANGITVAPLVSAEISSQ